MPNVYYLPPAWVSGIGDLLASFSLRRQQKEEMEAQARANRQAQGNQAAAGAFGNIAGGAIGGLIAGSDQFSGLNPAQRLSLATSFMPSGGQISRTSGGIGADVAQGERQAASDVAQAQRQAAIIQGQTDLENLRSRNDAGLQAANLATQAYIDQYGQAPPTNAAGFAGQFGGGAQQDDPSGVPSPSINPAMTPAYRKAQQAIAAYEAHMARPMSPGERQAIQQSVGPAIQQAYDIVRRSQPPPPPRTEQELIQAGMVIPSDGGGNWYQSGPGKWSFANPAKQDAPPTFSTPGEAQVYAANRFAKLPNGQEVIIQPDGKLTELKDDDGDGFDARMVNDVISDLSIKEGDDKPIKSPDTKAVVEEVAKRRDAAAKVKAQVEHEKLTFKAVDLALSNPSTVTADQVQKIGDNLAVLYEGRDIPPDVRAKIIALNDLYHAKRVDHFR